jgi:hypothetical protein
MMLTGCSSTEPYREIDVQLSSGELKKDVRVLVDEDVETARISIVCRTFENRRIIWLAERRTRPRRQEICASPSYWADLADLTRWVHPEKGTAELSAHIYECLNKAARRNSESRYIHCMEEKGYHLLSLDE